MQKKDKVYANNKSKDQINEIKLWQIISHAYFDHCQKFP